MKRFVEGEDLSQSNLFPERLHEYIEEDNPVRVLDVFIDELHPVANDRPFSRRLIASGGVVTPRN